MKSQFFKSKGRPLKGCPVNFLCIAFPESPAYLESCPKIGSELSQNLLKYEILAKLQRKALTDYFERGGVESIYEIPFEDKEDSRKVQFILSYIRYGVSAVDIVYEPASLRPDGHLSPSATLGEREE